MNFNEHWNLKGAHAFLSPSSYHWINYDEDKLVNRYLTYQASARGTALHEFADQAIKLGIKLPRTKQTLNSYINDAIGFRMRTEQVLYYSENAFGTADALSFKDDKLRIHDLKTGVTRSSINQLRVYTALFCLEYGFRPSEISAELRIYQNDEVLIEIADPMDIIYIMDRIKTFDEILKAIKEEEPR